MRPAQLSAPYYTGRMATNSIVIGTLLVCLALIVGVYGLGYATGRSLCAQLEEGPGGGAPPFHKGPAGARKKEPGAFHNAL